MDDIVLRPRATSSTGAVHEKPPRLETGDTSFKNIASLVNQMYTYFRGSYKIDIDFEVNLRLLAKFKTYIAFIDEHIGVVVEALGRFRIQIQADRDFRVPNDDVVTTLNSIISELKAGLNTFIATSEGLLKAGVGMADPMNKASQLASAWTKVATIIEVFVDVLRKNSAADFSSTDSLSAVDSSDEISSYQLADVHGKNARLAPIKGSHLLLSGDDEKVQADLGPPPTSKVVERLRELGDSTRKVIEQFDVSLSHPYLDQFLCTHPDNYSASNLLIVMRHYRKKYFELKLDTHSAVRALRTYAVAQEVYLPHVVADNEKQNSDNGTPLSEFIANNASAVEDCKKKADDLLRRSTLLKDEWVSVVKIVEEEIEDFGKKNKDKRAEERKETLKQLCFSLGLTVFSGAAFLTGGILVPLAGVMDDAKNTTANLHILVQLCTKVENSVSLMACNWSDITTYLDDFHKRIVNGPGGSNVLKNGIEDSIDNWVEVRKAADNYLKL